MNSTPKLDDEAVLPPQDAIEAEPQEEAGPQLTRDIASVVDDPMGDYDPEGESPHW